MRAPFLSAVLALTAAVPLAAQGECATYSGRSRRVCDAAVDGTRAFHPVAGLLASGGNPVLGTANTLGGLGSFAISARANAANVVLPEPGYDGTASSVPASDELYAPVPLLEVAAGLYGGNTAGLFSVDFLGSALLIPTDQISGLAVEEGARRIGDVGLGLGYGLRVGILRDTGPLPAVSVSVMRRDIPQVAYGDFQDGDQYRYAVDLNATNLRLVASKQVAMFDLAAGIGWDRYSGNAEIRFLDPLTSIVQPEIDLELEQSRALLFVDAGVNLAAFTLVGELGYQTGKDQELSTDFEEFDTTRGKVFAGLGLRVGF